MQKLGYTILEQNFVVILVKLISLQKKKISLYLQKLNLDSLKKNGLPCEAVTTQKQNHIIQTANIYLSENQISNSNIRFDVAEILQKQQKLFFRYIENAFLAGIGEKYMPHIKQKNHLQYITFENLEKTNMVNHCFTTRLGGVSQGVYAQLNLSFTRGEEREKVLQNYHILCDTLGFDFNSFVLCHQTHTTNIRVVTEQDRGMGVTKQSTIKDTDALITNIPNIQLVAFSADCTPIFLLDTNKKAIAVIHAGWRGTVNGIAKKTIEKMTQTYGTNPKDIIAGIGPCIGQCCFQ